MKLFSSIVALFYNKDPITDPINGLYYPFERLYNRSTRQFYIA
jgi:hypothetical protein